MPYILFILVIYIICIMYIHNMLFHMVPFSASAFKVPFGFCYCHKICTKKRKKTSIKQTVHMRFLFSCHVFTVCIRTEKQNQAVGSYSLFFAWLYIEIYIYISQLPCIYTAYPSKHHGEIQLIQETSRQKNHSLALHPTQNTNIMNQSPGILLFTEKSWQMDVPTVPQKYGVS